MKNLHPTFWNVLFDAMDSDGRWPERIYRGWHLWSVSSRPYEALL